MLNPEVSDYFENGCGRCKHYGTPACRVHLWPDALAELRTIALSTGLNEVQKWGVPCYINDRGKNIALLGAFKQHCLISFFKGALLSDPTGMLEKPGSNSQSTRQLRFTTGESVRKHRDEITAFLIEAIKNEAQGKQVVLRTIEENDVPEEVMEAFSRDPELALAFERLTPGRRRAYLMHFGQPKQPKTREARILKARENILNGIGLNDHYQMKMRRK